MIRNVMMLLVCALALAVGGCNKASDKPAQPAKPAEELKLAQEPVSTSNIFEAIRSANLDDVKRFLARGTNVNAVDAEGYSPLHIACAAGYANIAQLLIDKGADVNAITPDGITPLHSTSMTGTAACATLLLDRGAKVMAQDNNQMTPLHTAALKGNISVAEVLIARGADVNSMTTTQWTPMRVADYGKQPDFVAFLQKHGARQ